MFKKVLAVMVCAVIMACVAPPLMTAWATTDEEVTLDEEEFLLEEIENDVESDLFSFASQSENGPKFEAEAEISTAESDVVNEEIEEQEGPDLQKIVSTRNIINAVRYPRYGDVVVKPGEDFSLKIEVEAERPELITYEWTRNYKALAEKGDTLSISEYGPGNYKCYFRDECGYRGVFEFNVEIDNNFTAVPILLEGDAVVSQENGNTIFYVPEGSTIVVGVDVSAENMDGITYSSSSKYWNKTHENAFTFDNITSPQNVLVTVTDTYQNKKEVRATVTPIKFNIVSEPHLFYYCSSGETLTLEYVIDADEICEIKYTWSYSNPDCAEETLSGLKGNSIINCSITDQFYHGGFKTITVRTVETEGSNFTATVEGEYLGVNRTNSGSYQCYAVPLHDDGTADIHVMASSTNANLSYAWQNYYFDSRKLESDAVIPDEWSEDYLHLDNVDEGFVCTCTVSDSQGNSMNFLIEVTGCQEHDWGEIREKESSSVDPIYQRYTTCKKCGVTYYYDLQYPILEPEITSLVCEEDGIRVTWNATQFLEEAAENMISNRRISIYRIYRRIKGETTWQYCLDEITNQTDSEISYLDDTVKDGVEYEYSISALANNRLYCSSFGTHVGSIVYHWDNASDIMLPFTDVDETDWYYDAIVDVYHRGLMTGMDPTTFAPELELNRAFLAAVMYRRAGYPETPFEPVFPDVKEDDWFAASAIWARSTDNIYGYEDGNFGATDDLNREQLCTILWRYADTTDGYDNTVRADLSGFPDANKISEFAQDAVSWCVATGIFEDRNGRLAAWETATRAELAVMLSRYLAMVEQ